MLTIPEMWKLVSTLEEPKAIEKACLKQTNKNKDTGCMEPEEHTQGRASLLYAYVPVSYEHTYIHVLNTYDYGNN